MYERTIPRDLFNEAKLLKCMGQLALLIHDGLQWPLALRHNTADCPGFDVSQDPSDGGLFVNNLVLTLGDSRVTVRTSYNSKAPYPLVFDDEDGGEGSVFDDAGNLDDGFCDYLTRLTFKERTGAWPPA